MKIRILDLFCGAGGAAMGYALACKDAGCEYEIVGVDNKPQPRYPFQFVLADAMTYPLDGFDIVRASPPCQDHTTASAPGKALGKSYDTGWMLEATYQRFQSLCVLWEIENVAQAPMHQSVMLCGSMFGLRVLRHRKFDSNYLLYPPCGCYHAGNEVGVYGNHVYAIGTYSEKWKRRANGRRRPVEYPLAVANEAMGINWMNWGEICQAIPPAYTRWLGRQILAVLGVQP